MKYESGQYLEFNPQERQDTAHQLSEVVPISLVGHAFVTVDKFRFECVDELNELLHRDYSEIDAMESAMIPVLCHRASRLKELSLTLGDIVAPQMVEELIEKVQATQ